MTRYKQMTNKLGVTASPHRVYSGAHVLAALVTQVSPALK